MYSTRSFSTDLSFRARPSYAPVESAGDRDAESAEYVDAESAEYVDAESAECVDAESAECVDAESAECVDAESAECVDAGFRFSSCLTVFDGVAPRASQSFTFAVSTESCFSSFSIGW
jgi:hypothetical protein